MHHGSARSGATPLRRLAVFALTMALVALLGFCVQGPAWADEVPEETNGVEVEVPSEDPTGSDDEPDTEEAPEGAGEIATPVATADNPWAYEMTQRANATTADFTFPDVGAEADTVTVRATMTYGGVTTRDASASATVENGAASLELDFTTYGKFNLTVTFFKDGATVHEESTTVGIVADEYNICPVSATLPMTWFSLSLFGEDSIRYTADGDVVPTVVLFERPASWNFDALPEGVYPLPYLTVDQVAYQPGSFDYASVQFRNYTRVMEAYVKDLYEVSPDSTFHLYCVDYYCGLVQSILYDNNIPQGQYSVVLMSDGSYSYNQFANAYKSSNTAATHDALKKQWQNARTLGDYKLHGTSVRDCLWALVDLEPNAEWWLARPSLLTSGDNGAFAQAVQSNRKCVRKYIDRMLNELQQSDEDVAAFKALFNFSDTYFAEAEEQGKDVMMFLGSTVSSEKGSFPAYARFTQTFYGDSYVYYYKGHPGSPTDMNPSKQAELEELGITDVDSSIAAELILFFYPEIYLSGYGSSTYASLPSADMAKGMFRITKAEGLQNESYAVMDWWMSPLSSYSDASLRKLGGAGDRYMVEFSDALLADADYDFAIWNDTSRTIFFYKMVRGNAVLMHSQASDGVRVGILYSALSSALTVDISGGSTASKANAQVYKANDSMAQRFRLIPNADGTYCIQNVNSGLVLDVESAGTKNGTNVRQYTANGTDAQKWYMQDAGDGNGTVYFVSKCNGLYLDVKGSGTKNGTNLQVYAGNGSKAQKFTFASMAPALGDGLYEISSGLSIATRVDVAGASLKSKANVQLYAANGTAAQVFRVTTDWSTGCIRIYNAQSGMSLDVTGGSTASRTNVQQYTPNETKSQSWNLWYGNGDVFTITSANGGGKALDVTSARTANGTNIQMYTPNGTKAQQWVFKAA